MPVSCPNLSSPLYQEVELRYGRRMVYLVHTLLEHPLAKAQLGDHPQIDEDLNVTTLDGRVVTLDSIIRDYIPAMGRRALRPYIRGQKEGSDAVSVLNRLSHTEERNAEVARALLALRHHLKGVLVVIEDDLAGERGYYEYENGERTIKLSASRFASLSPEQIRHTLLHEIVHALTVHALRHTTTPEEIHFRDSMTTLWKITRDVFPEERGSYSVEEFVAEALSNEDFQAKIRQAREGSIWRRFLMAVRRLLGLKEDSILEAVLRLPEPSLPSVGEGRFAFVDDPTPEMERLAGVYERIVRSLQRRINELSREVNTPGVNREMRKLKAEKEIILKALEKGEKGRAIVRALAESSSTINDLLSEFKKRYKNNRLSFTFTERMVKTTIAIEDFLGPLRSLLSREPDVVEDAAEIIKQIEKLRNNIQILKDNHAEVSIKLHAQRLSQIDFRTEREYQRRFEKEFEKENDRKSFPSLEHFRDARARWVSEKMQEARPEIEQKKRDRLERELYQGQRDVGRFSALFRAFQDVGDDLLAMAKQILDRVMDTVRERYDPIESRLTGLVNQLMTERGTKDPDVLYREILERSNNTGDKTGFYVSEYRMGDFLKAREAFIAAIEKETDPIERSRMWNKWYKENYEQEYTKEWYDLIESLLGKRDREYYEIQRHITDILHAYKLDDGSYDLESIPTEIWKEVQRLTDERNKHKEKSDEKIGEIAESQETEEWHRVNKLKRDTLSEEEYIAWYKAQFTSKGQLLGVWTRFVPKPELRERFVNENYTGPGVLRKSVWGSRQWEELQKLPKNSAIRQLYDLVIELQTAFDKNRPESRKLGYRIPTMRRTLMEKVASRDLSREELQESFKQATQITEDDTEFGPVYENAEGFVGRNVPIFFTTRMDPKEISYDVGTVTARNAYHAISYEEKGKVAPQLESLHRRLGEREVIARDKRGKPIETTSGFSVIPKGDEHIYKAFTNLLEKELYGMKKKEERGVKVIERLLAYNSVLLLGGNLRAAVSNLTVGQLMANVHFAAGETVSKKAWHRAYGVYVANGIRNLSDMGSTTKESPVNILLELFDGMNEMRGNRYHYSDGGRVQRLLTDGSVFHGLTGMVEHFNQGLTLLAILSDIKAMDKDGNYLTLSGETTEDPTKAMSLYEAYIFKGHEAHLHEKVSKIRFDGLVLDWNQDTKFLITQKARGINKRVHGGYAEQNRGEIYRHLWGRIIMQMRGWLFPQWDTRWRGFGLVNTWKGIENDVFDWELRDHFEGYYTTLYRFMGKVYRERDGLALHVMASWKDMTAEERRNVMRAILELGIMGSTILLYRALEELVGDDDPDDIQVQGLYFIAYLILRVRMEFAFFLLPQSMIGMVRDPAAAVSTLTDMTDLMLQLLNPTDRYEAGRNRGELRLRVKAERMVPMYRQVENLLRNDEIIKYYNFR